MRLMTLREFHTFYTLMAGDVRVSFRLIRLRGLALRQSLRGTREIRTFARGYLGQPA